MKQKKSKSKNVALERELMGPEGSMQPRQPRKKKNRWIWLERAIYVSGTLLACTVLAAVGISYDRAHGVGRYGYNFEPDPDPSSTNEPLVKVERHEEAIGAMAPIADNNSESKDSEIETETQDGGIIWYAPDWYDNTRLSYMDFRTITAPDTLQYQMQYDGYTVTDGLTGIRKRGDRYMIALGQEFGLTGTEVDVHLENGVEIPCIVGDSKEYFDTINGEGRIGNDGGIVEFIVDTDYLPEEVVWLGSNEAQFDHDWQSPVEYIVIY
jgi:hypothetical protein